MEGLPFVGFVEEPVFQGECGAFPLEYRLDGKSIQAGRKWRQSPERSPRSGSAMARVVAGVAAVARRDTSLF
jgi:hypothetical protein